MHIITVHPPSQYTCVRDGKIGKDEFKYDSLWKAADAIVKKRLSGHIRLKRIMELNNTKSSTIAEMNGEEIYNKEEDTVLGIKGVIALVSSKSPLSFFEDSHVKDWVRSLNPRHRLPYRIMRIRMLQVVQDLNVLEFARIVKDRREDLIEAYVCGQTDMWKDSHRKENFGALVFTVVAHRYTLNDGRQHFMSEETAERLKREGKLVSVRAAFAECSFSLHILTAYHLTILYFCPSFVYIFSAHHVSQCLNLSATLSVSSRQRLLRMLPSG